MGQPDGATIAGDQSRPAEGSLQVRKIAHEFSSGKQRGVNAGRQGPVRLRTSGCSPKASGRHAAQKHASRPRPSVVRSPSVLTRRCAPGRAQHARRRPVGDGRQNEHCRNGDEAAPYRRTQVGRHRCRQLPDVRQARYLRKDRERYQGAREQRRHGHGKNAAGPCKSRHRARGSDPFRRRWLAAQATPPCQTGDAGSAAEP